MEHMQTTFFLGASTPDGFHSFFNELYDPESGWYCYILKGGPGTGKSSLMKQLAKQLEERGLSVVRIACSSDPHSLDAVICPAAKTCIADGTAPHVLDPKFPGIADEIINLGVFWDQKKLEDNQEDILLLTQQNAACHKRCQRFLSAAGTMKADIRRLAQEYLNTDKIQRYASRTAAKLFPRPNGQIGTESHRFLSAVTPLGIYPLYATLEAICPQLYVIEDPYGAASPLLLESLRCYALGNGLDVISCPCPLAPAREPEHLLLPQLGLGFITANRYHPAPSIPHKTVRASRFLDVDGLRARRGRISFTRRAQKELLAEAAQSMADAKELHDWLEEYYVGAMDFSAMMPLRQGLLEGFLKRV